MAKICTICSKHLGMLTMKQRLSDGWVCSNCLHKSGIGFIPDSTNITSDNIKKMLHQRNDMVCAFSATKREGNHFEIDENNRLFRVNGTQIFEYRNLIKYDVENHYEQNTKNKGGVGRAVVGGVMFGAVGAIVGANTAKHVTQEKLIGTTIKLYLKDTYTNNVDFYLIGGYGTSEITGLLENILIQINETPSNQAPLSAADEIAKYKQLLDIGAISHEEFEIKKKQLLGL